MKLTNFQAQRLLGALNIIDKDETTKLEPEVRLAIAININRLMDQVLAFQRIGDRLTNEKLKVRAKATGSTIPGEAVEAVRQMVDLDDQITALTDSNSGLERLKLKKLNIGQLNLKDNVKIKGDMIASLAPIIRDFDDGEGDED